MCDKGQRGREELGSMAIASYSFSVSSGSTEARLFLDSEKEGGGGRESGEQSFHSSVPGQHLLGSGFYPQHHKDEKQNKKGTAEKTVFW